MLLQNFGLFGGLHVIESWAATALPKLKEPHTDDMRAMVDDLLVRNPPQRRPVAFMMGGKIVAHPSIAAELRVQLAQRGM